VKCAFVALTGRGVVSIIQAIVGVIFSIEGFWGAVKFDGPTVKRFLIFLVAYFFVSAAISVINLQTLDEYCSTAVDENDKKYCLDTSRLYSYLLLAATLAVLVSRAGEGRPRGDKEAQRQCGSGGRRCWQRCSRANQSTLRLTLLAHLVLFVPCLSFCFPFPFPFPSPPFQPLIFGFGVVFYLSIPASGLLPRRRTGGSALDVYQLTDAMGFSSD